MATRITISRGKDGFFQIWLNPEGRDHLVRELQKLSPEHDHFHIMPEDMRPQLPARNRPYEEGDEVIEWGKVLFRSDEWDARHYPHVLDQTEPGSDAETSP